LRQGRRAWRPERNGTGVRRATHHAAAGRLFYLVAGRKG